MLAAHAATLRDVGVPNLADYRCSFKIPFDSIYFLMEMQDCCTCGAPNRAAETYHQEQGLGEEGAVDSSCESDFQTKKPPEDGFCL